MKKRIVVSNCTLQMINGELAAAWSGINLYARDKELEDVYIKSFAPSFDEEDLLCGSHDVESYLLLPNVRSPKSLIKACESFTSPIINQYKTTDNASSISNKVSLETICEVFQINNPTRTAKHNIDETIRASCHDESGSFGLSYLPIKDILAMVHDLLAIMTMFLYSKGNACSEQMLKRNTSSGLKLFEAEALGLECYQKHIDMISPYIAPAQYEEWYRDGIALILASEVPSESSESVDTLKHFSEKMITSMMSSLSPAFSDDGFFVLEQRASLDGAYAFWAKECLKGKAAVCDHCGKLFIRKRKTARFCSDACRVAAHAAKNK